MNCPRRSFRLRLVFALGVVILLAGCQTPPSSTSSSIDSPPAHSDDNVQRHKNTISDAWKAYRENRFSAVIDMLEPLRSTRRSDVDVPMLLALSHYRLDEYEQSHQYWNETVQSLNNAQQLQKARSYRRRTRKLTNLNLTTHTYNHFRILLPDNMSKRVANDLNHQLERAYQQIGGDLGYHPERKTSVIIYEPGPYRRVINAPIWSGGLFDGKIHLKYDTSRTDPINRRTLFHEYTHAVIHVLARDNVPLWFNEGLATYEEYRQSNREFRYDHLPEQRPRETIRHLGGINSMFRSDTDQGSKVRLGYEYSYALVQFMEYRYGLETIKTILKKTGKTSSFEQALVKTINMNSDRLQFSWENWVSNEFQ